MGVEPTTPALRKRCSAIELLRRLSACQPPLQTRGRTPLGGYYSVRGATFQARRMGEFRPECASSVAAGRNGAPAVGPPPTAGTGGAGHGETCRSLSGSPPGPSTGGSRSCQLGRSTPPPAACTRRRCPSSSMPPPRPPPHTPLTRRARSGGTPWNPTRFPGTAAPAPSSSAPPRPARRPPPVAPPPAARRRHRPPLPYPVFASDGFRTARPGLDRPTDPHRTRKEKLGMSKPRRRRKIGSKKRKARRDRRKR